MPELLIKSGAVHEAVYHCLYEDTEVAHLAKDHAPESAVHVAGITGNFFFHPERLESHRSEVRWWLEALPHQFREGVAGGWSFLQACNQENGAQWTGSHKSMEELFVLGMALGMVKESFPREMWPILVGGMPYYTVMVP